MTKPKVAFYWCAACGGCEEAVVDLNDELLAAVELVDVVFWPVALDFKRVDVEALGRRRAGGSVYQRCGAHLRTGGNGRPPAPQVPGRGGLRELRRAGRDPGLANLYDRPGHPRHGLP